MNDSKTPRATGETSVRRRSWVERLLVWGGILTLLAVVLIEWTSRRDFDATLADLEAAIQSKRPPKTEHGLLPADLDHYVHGFAFRGQVKQGSHQQKTYRWLSVFKFYKLGVTIDDRYGAFVVDTFAPDAALDVASPTFTPPATKLPALPAQGLPQEEPQKTE